MDEKQTMQGHVNEAMDMLIARTPGQHEHQWIATTSDDVVQWCSVCGKFRIKPEDKV